MATDALSKAIHAFANDALAPLDAIELSQKVRHEELCPNLLTKHTFERAKNIGSKLNAIESELFDLDQVEQLNKQRNKKRVFSGIPTFVKDNVGVRGHLSGYGSEAIRPFMEYRDDPYAKQFLKLGFTVVGKSSLPEFGFNASTEPAHKAPTRNPWNKEHSAGASSGGAAALVASGIVPIAHANDGGGSIRIPAACCGLVGLKPSRDRHIHAKPARTLPINIVSQGVVTRSVRDTAFFHFEAEREYRNSRLKPIGLVLEPHEQRRKIALVLDPSTGAETDQPTRQATLKVADLLTAAGHIVEEVEYPLPAKFAEHFALYWAMMAFGLKNTGKLAFGRRFVPDKVDQLTEGLAKYYRERLINTPAALIQLVRLSQKGLNLFESYDALLSPTLGHLPPKLGYLSPDVPFEELFDRLRGYVGFTPFANVAGAPAISIPVERSKENLPISIQLMANVGNEDLLLSMAYELEALCDWKHLFELK